jgi:hypothetical protein
MKIFRWGENKINFFRQAYVPTIKKISSFSLWLKVDTSLNLGSSNT